MDTSISRRVAARPALIFSRAAQVEYWPRLLPHYRWVRVLEQRSPVERVVDMAARRPITDRVGIPLHWTSIQRLDSQKGVIGFEHIAGISRGMQVTWVRAESGGVDPARCGGRVATRDPGSFWVQARR